MDLGREITGVVLAGGRSIRFGSNKALARWRGKHLIQHVIDSLAAVFNDLLLSTNTPEQYEFLKLPMVMDIYQDLGPMAGIHAALSHSRKPWIFVAGCDMPSISPVLITCLCDYADRRFDAVLPWLAKGPEPLCGLYHQSSLPEIERELKAGKVKMKELAEKLSVRKVTEAELSRLDGEYRVFSNINRIRDLQNL